MAGDAMTGWRLEGEVRTGAGKAAQFTAMDWVRRGFVDGFGIEPYPGTLNLVLTTPGDVVQWLRVIECHGVAMEAPGAGQCDSVVLPLRAGGTVPAVAVIPQVPGYPAQQVEVVAAVNLRKHFALSDGQRLALASADLAGVSTLIFDVDGTLVDSITGIQLAASRAAAMFGYDVPRTAVCQALDAGESLWNLIMPAHLRGDPELTQLLRQETMRHWTRVLDESVDVVPGLEHTLRSLQVAGLRLGIVTGSRGESFLPLRRRDLMQHFEAVITADDVTRQKPDPEGLLDCMRQMAIRPEEAVYVGDTRTDVAAGRAAGMRTIGVLSGAADSMALSAAGADRIVPSHSSLSTLIRGRRSGQ